MRPGPRIGPQFLNSNDPALRESFAAARCWRHVWWWRRRGGLGLVPAHLQANMSDNDSLMSDNGSLMSDDDHFMLDYDDEEGCAFYQLISGTLSPCNL